MHSPSSVADGGLILAKLGPMRNMILMGEARSQRQGPPIATDMGGCAEWHHLACQRRRPWFVMRDG